MWTSGPEDEEPFCGSAITNDNWSDLSIQVAASAIRQIEGDVQRTLFLEQVITAG